MTSYACARAVARRLSHNSTHVVHCT